MAIRVVLGEDNLLVREAVLHLLGIDPELEVVVAVGDMASLRDACERERPDIRMPPTHTDEGISMVAELRETHPDIGVVVLSQYDGPVYALAPLDHGSDRRA